MPQANNNAPSSASAVTPVASASPLDVQLHHPHESKHLDDSRTMDRSGRVTAVVVPAVGSSPEASPVTAAANANDSAALSTAPAGDAAHATPAVPAVGSLG